MDHWLKTGSFQKTKKKRKDNFKIDKNKKLQALIWGAKRKYDDSYLHVRFACVSDSSVHDTQCVLHYQTLANSSILPSKL
jgi:hypothetical protein